MGRPHSHAYGGERLWVTSVHAQIGEAARAIDMLATHKTQYRLRTRSPARQDPTGERRPRGSSQNPVPARLTLGRARAAEQQLDQSLGCGQPALLLPQTRFPRRWRWLLASLARMVTQCLARLSNAQTESQGDLYSWKDLRPDLRTTIGGNRLHIQRPSRFVADKIAARQWVRLPALSTGGACRLWFHFEPMFPI